MSLRHNGGTNVAPAARTILTVTTSSCANVATTATSVPISAATPKLPSAIAKASEDAAIVANLAFASAQNPNAKKLIAAVARSN